MPDNKLILPKQVELDPRYQEVKSLLNDNTEKLWPGSSVLIPVPAFSLPVKTALKNVQEKKRMPCGADSIERILGVEARGLSLVDKKTGVARVQRISRLLIVSNDGAERLYRKVESILRRHGSRVMAIRLDADSKQLGEHLYGPEKAVKLLLVENKEDVAAILLALADSA